MSCCDACELSPLAVTVPAIRNVRDVGGISFEESVALIDMATEDESLRCWRRTASTTGCGESSTRSSACTAFHSRTVGLANRGRWPGVSSISAWLGASTA